MNLLPNIETDPCLLGRVIRSIDASFEEPWQVIGNDLKLAFHLDAIRPSKHSRVFYRPAVEPILLAHWEGLASLTLNEDQAQSLCSILVGAKQQRRTKRMYGVDYNGDRLQFAALPSRHWLQEVRRLASMDVDWIDKIAAVFPFVINEHPFTDGNGRLARALVYAVMAKSEIIRTPSFGANATLDLGREAIGSSVRHAIQANDMEPLRSELMRVFAQSACVMMTMADLTADRVQAL